MGLMPEMSAGQAAVVSILLWWVTNIFTVIANKWIFQILQFAYPLTLTGVHMLVCSVGAWLTLRVFKAVPFVQIPLANCLTNVFPLALIFFVNIILGNISLRFIPVSFMQTIKSAVPAFTVLLQVFGLGMTFPRGTYLALVPVVGGVAMATATEVNFEMIGFTCALVACLTTAVQSVLSSVLLTGQYRLDSVNLLYYMAPLAFLVNLPFAYYFEAEDVMNRSYVDVSAHEIVLLLFLSGFVAFLLNLSVFFAIKSTSALTFTVFGNLKVVIVILLSVIIFQNEITAYNGMGCVVAFMGICAYSYQEYTIKEQKRLAALEAVKVESLEEEKADA
jgi:drug/metabolite transporter (DMT)-like permease